METDKIFDIVKKNIADVLTDVDINKVTIEQSLADIGANSIDRGQIAIQSMADLKIQVPLIELGKASNIQTLIEILQQYTKQKDTK